MPTIIRFDTATPETSSGPIDNPLEGNPQATTRNFYGLVEARANQLEQS